MTVCQVGERDKGLIAGEDAILFNRVTRRENVWVARALLLVDPVGSIVMYQGYFGMILGSISALMNVYPMIAKGFESISSITEILKSPDIENNAGKLKLPEHLVEGIDNFAEALLLLFAGGHTGNLLVRP